MGAAEFVTTIVHDALGAVEVHEGTNFRFGYRAEGGTPELDQLGRTLGFDVVIHGACQVRGLTCSSSKIRELLSRGDIRTARALLGHGFFVDSTLAHGRGIGSKLTVPTINLAPYRELLPPNGVYVTQMRVAGEWFDAVTNVATGQLSARTHLRWNRICWIFIRLSWGRRRLSGLFFIAGFARNGAGLLRRL